MWLRLCAGLILLLSGVDCLSQLEPVRCLSYEPAVVALHGTLSRKTFAGPPNYEDVRKGDKAETFWFLSLVSPICMNEDKSEPDLDPSRENIRKVQLVLVEVGAYDRVKALVGKKVVATGTLIGGISAHHHTPVLLTIKSIHVGR